MNGKALGDILIDLGNTTSSLITSVLSITRRTEQQLARLFNASTGNATVYGIRLPVQIYNG